MCELPRVSSIRRGMGMAANAGRLLLVVFLAATLLTGCTRRYVVTLNNGTRFTTFGKPKLRQGAYVFKDIKGEPGYVPAVRVSEIAPASMVSEKGRQFIPSGAN